VGADTETAIPLMDYQWLSEHYRINGSFILMGEGEWQQSKGGRELAARKRGERGLNGLPLGFRKLENTEGGAQFDQNALPVAITIPKSGLKAQREANIREWEWGRRN